jgi:hypothetical protein
MCLLYRISTFGDCCLRHGIQYINTFKLLVRWLSWRHVATAAFPHFRLNTLFELF